MKLFVMACYIVLLLVVCAVRFPCESGNEKGYRMLKIIVLIPVVLQIVIYTLLS